MKNQFVRSFLALITVCMFSTQAFAQTGESPTLVLEPSSGTFAVGETITVAVKLDTASQETDAADVVIQYDPTLLNVVDDDEIRDGIQVTEGTLYEVPLTHEVDTALGTITLKQTSLTDFYITEDTDTAGTLATITFEALAEGAAEVSFLLDLDDEPATQVLSGTDNILESTSITNASFTIGGEGSTVAPAEVANILLSANVTSLQADGISEAQFTARAIDANGVGVPNAAITLSVSGDAILTPASTMTDTNGELSATLRASTTAGMQTVTASLDSNSALSTTLDITLLDTGAPVTTEELPTILETGPERLSDSGPANNILIAFMGIVFLSVLAQIRSNRYEM